MIKSNDHPFDHLDELIKKLDTIVNNGIYVDKNLRQPTFYSNVTFLELKVECFSIICDLLTNQKIPIWISQRISWYYVAEFFEEIKRQLTSDYSPNKTEIETKTFSREKLVLNLRNSISNIVKRWLDQTNLNRSSQMNVDNLILSFSRFNIGSADITALKRTNLWLVMYLLIISSINKKHNCVNYHEFGIKNKRRTMEDKVALYENLNIFKKSDTNLSIRPISLFGVFDGHCGVDCSQYVSSHLPLYIVQQQEFANLSQLTSVDFVHSVNNLVTRSFKIINQRFTEKAIQESIKGGSTACITILWDSYLNVAWCGDTQFCLVKNGKIDFISLSHSPENENERKRIEKSGGSVSHISNVWRLNGSLGVARSFGDVDYQNYGLTSDPDFKNFVLDGSEDYFIIGCDGLWDSIDLESMCESIYEQRNNVDNMAEYLVKLAKDSGSSDNISAIFVLLKDDLSQISKPEKI